MLAVFVHGVPDTAALWSPVVEHLTRRDVQCPQLPGFGAPIPGGFTCDKDAFASWLVDQVRAIGEPVDLVGHDWGALLAQRVAATHPELVRSWVLIDGAVSERFEWHDLARQWQTPGVGEALIDVMEPDAMASGLGGLGHPDPTGAAARVDRPMLATVLALYRSAIDVAAEWTPPPGAPAPRGLVVWGRHDPFGPPAFGRAAAERAGASFVELDAGHWSLLEQPADGAARLEQFWADR